MAAHDAGLLQLQKDLFQEFLGYVTSVSNLGYLERLAFCVRRQDQQGAKRVMRFLRKHDGDNTRLSLSSMPGNFASPSYFGDSLRQPRPCSGPAFRYNPTIRPPLRGRSGRLRQGRRTHRTFVAVPLISQRVSETTRL